MNKLNRIANSKSCTSIARVWLNLSMFTLIIAILITSVEFCAKDEAWVHKEYQNLNISDYTGMSVDDMCLAYNTMVNYMTGESDSMYVMVNCFGSEVEMYNAREKSHMLDVRALYSGVMIARNAMIVFAAVGITAFVLIVKKNRLEEISKSFLIALASVVGVIVLIGIWAAVDFESFWLVFHAVFLNIEDSTFDPAISRMKRVCPEKLFFDLIVRIFVIGIGVCIILTVIAGVYLLSRRNKKKAV